MQTLAADGWDKIVQGVTTVEEVTRVTFDTLSNVDSP
jgi:type II secretory ATPase GspE/PulE/Tfp pilus assembly ATPase PilB-like protein